MDLISINNECHRCSAFALCHTNNARELWKYAFYLLKTLKQELHSNSSDLPFTGLEGLPISSNYHPGAVCCWDCPCYFDVDIKSVQTAQNQYLTGILELVHDCLFLKSCLVSFMLTLAITITWQLVAILPLAVVHVLGNLFTNMSLGKVAVSFTHTIKAMEPFFSVVLSAMFLGEVCIS